jgi:hypothetical protein
LRDVGICGFHSFKIDHIGLRSNLQVIDTETPNARIIGKASEFAPDGLINLSKTSPNETNKYLLIGNALKN